MALKKSELYSSLWSSCDELRGGMDASQYKDYVLVLLFVKYVSDRYAGQRYAPITIPPGASFADMQALKGKKDIGDQINKKILGPLAQANQLADMPDFADPNKLGNDKEMVERLTNLISIFENPALDFSKNRADGDDLLGDAYEYLMRHFATESGKSKGQFYTPAEVSRVIAQIDRADMSEALRNSSGSIGTVTHLSRAGFAEELERLIGGVPTLETKAMAEAVEDASAFALEKHLEDFLVTNWAQTELGRDYLIYTEEGEAVGQQYQTDTGPLDILAISKDKKRLLVVELKKGRASDAVVGQTLRYMSYVQEMLAEEDQTVLGAIIAHEDDARIRRALKMTPNISFFRYQVSFKLVKG